MTSENKVLIVGAGPSGLAIAAQLGKAGINYKIIEKSDRVGNAWFHHYDRLHLHTVKQYSQLPFKNFPDNHPTYVSKFQVYEYYQEYAKENNIVPDFNTELIKIERDQDSWIASLSGNQKIKTKHIVLATGVNRIPYIPKWKGQENYSGKVLHSKYYKNPSSCDGNKILVIGMGNTGAEVALDLAENKKDTYISVRSPVNIVPRDVLGNPTQLTAIKLSKLPLKISDWLGNFIQKLTIGNLRKYGLETEKMPPAKQLRELNKTPVIDLGTVEQIKNGNIKVIGDISEFNQEGVITLKGEKIRFDTVILATGFKADISEFNESFKELEGRFNLPEPLIGEKAFKGLYFLGFNSNKQGGILGVIPNDSKIISEEIIKSFEQN